LLAVNKKYGSAAVRGPERENQCWSIGAPAATTKNGAPAPSASTPRSRSAGSAPAEAAGFIANCIGSIQTASATTVM
jgi:hypothetical protein